MTCRYMDNSSVEKRKCKRHNVTDFVVAVLANRLGRIINISECGLAVQLIDNDLESVPEQCETFFLSKDRGFLIENLPLKLVRKKVMPSPYISTVAAQFDTPDAIKLREIKQLIAGLS